MITPELIDEEIRDIDEKLAAVEPLRKRRAALADLRATYTSDEAHPRLLDAPGVSPSSRFKSLGTTDAMNAFLRESPGIFFSPREIGKAIMAGGHSSESPNFFNIVFTICKRKAQNGDYDVQEKDGKKVFRLKISNQP